MHGPQLPGCSGGRRIAQHANARDVRRDLLEQLQPFPADAVFERGEPGALPPGCARLATNPAPTGSMTFANTIGALRLACCSAATLALAEAKMTSGASPTNSIAYVR